MPRVPQVFSPGETGRTPGPRLDPGGFAKLSTGGLAQAADTIGEASEQYRKIYTTLRDEEQKLEAERALGEVQKQFVDADIQLKSDPTITPDQYPQEVERRLQTIRQGVSKALKYPGSRILFERGAERFVNTTTTKAKYEGLERMHAAVRSTTDLLLRQDANQAVTAATPELQQQAVDRGIARIQSLTQQRILSGAEASAKTTGFLAEVEEGGIRRDARNPALAPAILANLREGKHTTLGLERQRQIADSIETQMKADEAARKQAIADAEAEVAEEAEKGITDAIEAGNWAAARGFLASARRFLPATRYEHWKETITNREGKGAPSDPETKKALNLSVYSTQNNPRAELARVQAAYRENRLDDGDYKTFATHLQTRITRSEDKALTALGREHAQAEELMGEALRVNGPAAAILDTQAQALRSMALEDLSRNSAYLGKGNEAPLAWYARRKAFYQSQLATVATQRLTILQQQLSSVSQQIGVPVTDAQSLARARESLKSDADYYDALRMLKEASEIRAFQQSFKPGPAGSPTTGGGAAQTPSPVNTLGR